MQAVLTGDVVNSRSVQPEIWLEALKKTLSHYGTEPQTWEIYRGDSFQLLLSAQDALRAAFRIKACIKQNETLDVRLAIGLGDAAFKADKITASNGVAFIHSGEGFEQLKKRSMLLRSDQPDFDRSLNLMLQLYAGTSDQWSSKTANVLLTALANPDLNQKELAEHLGRKSQSTISEALKRGGYEALQQLLQWYETQIQKS